MRAFPFTLQQIRILKTIATEGSFKSAAQKLHISQPAISLQIKNLEQQLNVCLFNRNKKQIYLTEAGQLLLRYSNRILPLCEETFNAIQKLQKLQGGTLIIGGSQTTGTYLLPRIIGLFRHHYPQVNVELQVYSTRRIAWGVANGQIDIGIVGGEIPNELQPILEITPYVEDEFALILPPFHPLAKLKEIKKEDLYRLSFIALNTNSSIRKVIDKTLIDNGIDNSRFKIEMEFNSIEGIKNAVQSGLGVAFVSISSISKELELKTIHKAKITNLTVTRILSIIVNPSRYKSKASQYFSKEILTLFLTLQNPQI